MERNIHRINIFNRREHAPNNLCGSWWWVVRTVAWTIAACDVPLDRRIAIYRSSSVNAWTILAHSPGDESPLVAGLLRLLAADRLDTIRIVFNDQGEEGGEDEGETAGAEDVHEVRESL